MNTQVNKEITPVVWDLGVRLFHWTLLLSFIIAYLTGDEESNLHIYAGYTIIGLLVFRIIWGFVGGRHARFKDFIYSPQRIIAYCKGLMTGKIEHFEGHNPAGGAMIIAMLLCLVAIGYTGLKVYGLEGQGPLAAQTDAISLNLVSAAYADRDDEDDEREHVDRPKTRAGHVDHEAEEFWEEIHEFFAHLMVVLIILHLGGVALSSRLHGENLVRAMVTGRKSVT